MMPTPHRPDQPPAPKPTATELRARADRWIERLLREGERAQVGAPPPDRDRAPPEKEVSS